MSLSATGLNVLVHLTLGLVSLVAGVIALSGLSRRYDLPAPLVLVAAGLAASYLPFVPEVHLSAEVVLVGLLPPLLYSAALQSSLIDFKANRTAIAYLSVGLVAFTTVGVAFVVHAVLPGTTWPAAFAIGAVVAPPDAVAATAIARRIGFPRRVVTILEGESLLNDATALVALSTAVLAAKGEASVLGVGLDFLREAGGGIAVGVVGYAVVGWVRRRLSEPVLDTSVSMVTPFLAYAVAEELHVSGVLAVVFVGLLLGHQAPVIQTASSRVAERLNWQTVSFLLENTVFLLIGLQARWILADVADSALSGARITLVCVAVFVAVVLLRLMWVLPVSYLLLTPFREARREAGRWRQHVLVGWAGMRGVVTLAAAFAIPVSFPHRDVLVLVALTVTAGTLFVQGLSLPWVVRRLGVPSPDPREDALARAGLFQQATAAGLAWLDEQPVADDPHGTRETLRRRVEQRDFAAWERLGGTDTETPSEAYARMRLQMLQVERARVLEIRSRGRIPHEVVEGVLRALDVEESMLDLRMQRVEELRTALMRSVPTVPAEEACEHLESAPRCELPPPDDRACVDCLAQNTRWVHLRVCLTCGELRCCDSSPERHSTAHFHRAGHPVIQSAEPGEAWRWCYVDEVLQG